MPTIPLSIAADHPALPGHFPGRPIMPGVVLLDHALTAIAADLGLASTRCTIASVKFLQPVEPGMSLELRHEQTNAGGTRFEIVHGGKIVTSGALTFADAK